MGPTVTRPVQDPLAVLLLNNRLYILLDLNGGKISVSLAMIWIWDIFTYLSGIQVMEITFQVHCTGLVKFCFSEDFVWFLFKQDPLFEASDPVWICNPRGIWQPIHKFNFRTWATETPPQTKNCINHRQLWLEPHCTFCIQHQWKLKPFVVSL